jgi:AcrR family transcriptional regulator
MKDAILNAAIDLLVHQGLANWTVEEAARKAGCAKGLVNYHYRSKQELLVQAAESIRSRRAADRLAALETPGTSALDRLWSELTREVASGRFAAWLSLLAGGEPYRRAASLKENDTGAFTAALDRALGLEDQLETSAALIEATLDGLQLRLLQGAPAAVAEEAYQRFWLSVVA